MMFLTQYMLLPGYVLREVQEGGQEVVKSAQVDHVQAGETLTLFQISKQVQEQILQEGVKEEDQEAAEVDHVKTGETQTRFHLSQQVQEQLLREGVEEEDQEAAEVEGREGIDCDDMEYFGLS